MLTVDCRNVESIKHELLVYVSDQIGAIPAIKSHEFVLSPIDDEDTINAADVIASIKEFLGSIGEQRNFAVILQQDVVLIKSITGKALKRDAPRPRWECTPARTADLSHGTRWSTTSIRRSTMCRMTRSCT